MALRFSEEPTHRLSPREAREFLRVHAEREARGTAADAPTVEDLAETLGITDDEARSILQETRARTVPPRAKAKTNSQQEARVATIILACALVVAGSFFVVAPRSRSVPAPATLPAENLSPVATPPAPIPMVEPTVPALIQAPPPLVTAPSAPSLIPLADFTVQVDTPGGTFGTNGPTLGNGPDHRAMGADEAAQVQRALVATVLDLIRPVPMAKWDGAGEFRLSVMHRSGRWTRLVVPLGPSVDPEETRASLTKVVAAAWPQIVR